MTQLLNKDDTKLVGWLVGWLDGWMVGWLVGWMVGWLVGWLDGWLVCWSVISPLRPRTASKETDTGHEEEITMRNFRIREFPF